MVAVLLALARANRLETTSGAGARASPTRARISRRTRPRSRTAARFRGLRGEARRRHRRRQRGSHRDPLQPAGPPRPVLVRPDAPRTLRSRCRRTDVCHRRQRRRGAQRPAARATTTTARRATPRECSNVARATGRRDDVAGRRHRRIVADAPARLRACLRTIGALLDRFDQFVEESTRARAGRRRSARRRRPRRFRPDRRRSIAGAGRGTALATRCQKPSRWRDWRASTARLPRLPSAPDSAAASGRSSRLSDAPRFLDRWQNAYRTRASGRGADARVLLTRPGPASVRLDRRPTSTADRRQLRA